MLVRNVFSLGNSPGVTASVRSCFVRIPVFSRQLFTASSRGSIHFHRFQTIVTKPVAKGSHKGHYHSWSTFNNLALSSATAIAALGPGDDVPSGSLIDDKNPDEEADTREKAMHLAVQRADELKSRGLDKENASTMYLFIKNTKRLFFKYIIDPIATGFRFFHLLVLFGPVILSFPAVIFGPYVSYDVQAELLDNAAETKFKERYGAIVWFRYLTWTIEQAGPSFIKVSDDPEFWHCFSWCFYLLFNFSLVGCVYNMYTTFEM